MRYKIRFVSVALVSTQKSELFPLITTKFESQIISRADSDSAVIIKEMQNLVSCPLRYSSAQTPKTVTDSFKGGSKYINNTLKHVYDQKLGHSEAEWHLYIHTG